MHPNENISSNSTRRIDTKTLKDRIGDRWLDLFEEVAAELSEAVQHHGKHVPCPMHGGRDGFRLFPDAEVTGGGVCNTCGKYGDGIALLMAIKGWSFRETVSALESWLQEQGEEECGEGGRVACTTDAPLSPVSAPWVSAYIDRTMAVALFGHPRLAAYYRHRGLSIAPSPHLAFIPQERYVDDFEEGFLPAMVGFFQGPSGEVVCVHRTYLDPQGPGKAVVESPRKFSPVLFQGGLNGAALRLRDYNAILGLAEGIETAEAVFQATGIPTWACGSANGLERFTPPVGATKVVIWADHDLRGVGQLAGARLARRLFERGIVVKLLIPPEPDVDWLDILVTEGGTRLESAVRESRAYSRRKPGHCVPSETELVGVLS